LNEKYCIRVTSSDDESLCQHVVTGAGPKDSAGGDILIKHNGDTIATMPRGFKEFEHCLELDEIDVANDKFQLQSSNGDGACITSLAININQLLVGKNNNLPSFWIDGNDQYCLENFMSTSQITIQNGQVNSSTCKPMNQDGVVYIDPTEEDKEFCIRVTSGPDPNLCKTFYGNHEQWAGDEIRLKHNGEIIASLHKGFTNFSKCFTGKASDKIQLAQSLFNNVCITGLYLNNEQLFVGKNSNLPSFWLDDNGPYCLDHNLSTPEITIQDGEVTARIWSNTCPGPAF
jgi:hypothetical protein